MAENEVVRDGGVDHERIRAGLEGEHHRLVDLRRTVGGDVLDEVGPTGWARGRAEEPAVAPGGPPGDRERDQLFLEQLDRRLRDVDDALRRLERGEYGVCEVCGEPIGGARLEALPATRFCLMHQAMAEREGGRAGASGGRAGRPS
jgi:hypothetical protein